MFLNRYKSALFLFLLALAFTGCNKDTDILTDAGAKQEVTFNPVVSVDGKKSTLEVAGVNYCFIQIDTMVFRPATYTVNGKIYTQSIKLLPGSHKLNKFLMMNNNQTPDDFSDDIIMLATPMEGSEYASFVNRPAGFGFVVNRLKKLSVDIDVILFSPSDYFKFGFDFNVLPATTIRQQRFIGLIRPKNPADYSGSLYINQTTGLQNEMPAIFKINVYRNGSLVYATGNEAQMGESSVTVSYPDGDNTVDNFRFDLMVYVKTGTSYAYRYIKSWEFTDDEMIPFESDGMVHFLLGECGSTGVNGEIGPYINLPESCTFTIKPQWAPGQLGAYFDGELGNISTGFSVGNGLYRAWCGTDSVNININHTYNMDVYNSLTPSTLPAFTRSASRWNAINWLLNNLPNYAQASWGEIQGAVWKILNDWDGTGQDNIPDANSIVDIMVSDAMLHTGFIPTCGQKAAVIMVPEGTPREAVTPKLQVVFIMVSL